MVTTHSIDKEFMIALQISKTVIFEVSYYTIGGNKAPYFSTCANKFNQCKSDYTCGGQAQKELLAEGSVARKFYDKWDRCHLKDLTDSEYSEMVNDLIELQSTYNYIKINHRDCSRESIPFSACRELSMMPLRKVTNK